MAPNRSLPMAEARAMAGEAGESQESQLLLQQYVNKYGIGQTSSSPAPDSDSRATEIPTLPLQHESGKLSVKQKFVGRKNFGDKDGRRQPQTSQHARFTTSHDALRPTAQHKIEGRKGIEDDRSVKSAPALGMYDDAAPIRDPTVTAGPGDGSPPLVRIDSLPHLPSPTVPPVGRMESSQSPTQSNDDRSYERYGDQFTEPNDELRLGSQDFHEGGDRADSNSGMVDFGLTDHSRPSQPTHDEKEGSPFVDFPVPPPLSPSYLPETPAPPRNPFGAKDRAQVLGGSQLFGQTQFTSAIRRVSPTSSRPSPNDFPDNAISPNPVISSPTKARGYRSSPPLVQTSSPLMLPGASSEPQDGTDVPFYCVSSKDPAVIPESPRLEPRNRSKATGPLAEYEPMGKSQERRKISEANAQSSAADDESSDDETSRQLQARRKQQKASRNLSSIILSRPSIPDEVEVPSTNKKQQKRWIGPADYIAQCHGETIEGDSQGHETVADSQEVVAKDTGCEAFEDGKKRDGIYEEIGPPFVAASSSILAPPAGQKPRPSSLLDEWYSVDAIPETSPAERRLPASFGGLSRELSSGSSKSVPVPSLRSKLSRSNSLDPTKDSASAPSLPAPIASESATPRDAPASLDERKAEAAATSPEQSPEKEVATPTLPVAGSRRSLDLGNLSTSPPSAVTRAQRRVLGLPGADISSSQAPRSSAPPASTSTLSSLHTTPILSNSTTPATEGSGGSAQQRMKSLKTYPKTYSSPAISKARRRETLDALPKLRTAPSEAKISGRLTRHQAQQVPTSTDELARSPSQTPVTFEHSMGVSKTSAPRLARGGSKLQPATEEHSLRGGRVFEQMAFAISFQSKKPGETPTQLDDRLEFAKTIERKIQQAGGSILEHGFDELFEKPSVRSAATSPSVPGAEDINLLPTAVTTGFTALIADGHSRKAKYMQALALGLPCIAARWVTTCLDKEELVDWTPYLLCAGQSAFLGDAIRSRSLASYDAATARLLDVLKDKPRLLESSRILLVMKKADESKRMAYVFLARVLGASLSRVYTVDEARTKLKEMEDLNRPYDWVYVDEKADKGDLFGAPAAGENRKRKRASTNSSAGRAPKRIRTLSDELVIQSLILGRLIEEGEMGS